MRGAWVLLAGVVVFGLMGCKGAPIITEPWAANRQRPAPAAPGSEYAGRRDRGFEPDATPGRRSRGRQRRGRPAEPGVAGEFDYYLLNLSWSPEFCASHAGSEECGRRLGSVVHGLWPQNLDGTYPENCMDAPGPANAGALLDVMPTLSLVDHEWKTHGTCSGLGADAYFAGLRRAFAEVTVPAEIKAIRSETVMAPEEIVREFAGANRGFPAGSFALSCGNNRLTAIEVCMTKDLRPEACEGVRSCRAQVVKVTAP